MSEERTSPHNSDSEQSGLLLSVEEKSERAVDFATLSGDDNNAPADTDTEDTVGDTDSTDATDTDTTDDADGTD